MSIAWRHYVRPRARRPSPCRANEVSRLVADGRAREDRARQGGNNETTSVTQYVIRRLIQLIFVLIGVSLVVFLTMHVLPGDVATMLLGDRATNVQLEALRRQLGLDQPIYVQYLRFAIGAVEGDFGLSLRSNHPAFDDVWTAFPVTIQLSLAALAFAIAIGVPLGVLAALRPLSSFDNVVMTVTLFGVSMPIFWYGLMMILVFGAFLDWLPIGGLMPLRVRPPPPTRLSVGGRPLPRAPGVR